MAKATPKVAKPPNKRKKNTAKTSASAANSASPSANLRNKLQDKVKHMAVLVQEIMEELQAIEEKSLNDDHNSEATQESDLEQEDSNNNPTNDDQCLFKIHKLPFLANEQKIYEHTDRIESDLDILKTFDQNIDHTEEVIIGTEHGTTFPTQIGASICHALIDTDATRSCISEKYYQSLPLTKTQFMQNRNMKLATGSNLIPLGLINCSFELGQIKFNGDFTVCKNLIRPLILGRYFLIQNHVMV